MKSTHLSGFNGSDVLLAITRIPLPLERTAALGAVAAHARKSHTVPL